MTYTPAPPWRRRLISAFILFNFFAIPFSGQTPPREWNAIQHVVMPYLIWTRLNQAWPLFVPQPRPYAKRYHADIRFKDGRTAVWRRPYPPNWDFFERHLAYQFQKWDLASNYLDQKNLLWHDLAIFLKKTYWDDGNPPETITFVRETAPWLPPNPEGYAWHDGEEEQLQWKQETLFTYSVAGKDF